MLLFVGKIFTDTANRRVMEQRKVVSTSNTYVVIEYTRYVEIDGAWLQDCAPRYNSEKQIKKEIV